MTESSQTSNTETSPLTEVQSDSLELIWSRDPNLLTVEDVRKIVAKLQADRQRFLLEPEKVKKQRSSKTADLTGIKSIEDLGL